MTTDQEYAEIASKAYLVDPLKRNPPYADGSSFFVAGGKEFQVVLPPVSDASSGFQASLAASIGGLAVELQTIRTVNDSLVDQMQVARNAARSAAYLYPFVTEADIENCFDKHRPHVGQNIDIRAVEAVSADALSDIALVTQLSDGIARTVAHATAHDAQWAMILGQ